MTRYKTYLKSKGYKFNEDYDYLPWDNYHRQRETLEDSDCEVTENNELIVIDSWDVATIISYIGRDGEIVKQDFL